MPLVNFTVFVDKIEAGLRGEPAPVGKRQSIRVLRRYPIKVGDKLYLYTGCRTKHCRKLGEAVCNEVFNIFIDCNGSGSEIKVFKINKINRTEAIYGQPMFHKFNIEEGNDLAVKDGFKDAAEMLTWFIRTHGDHGALHEIFQVLRW